MLIFVSILIAISVAVLFVAIIWAIENEGMNRAADIIIWIAFIIMALAVLGVMSAAAYEILTGIGVGGPSE